MIALRKNLLLAATIVLSLMLAVACASDDDDDSTNSEQADDDTELNDDANDDLDDDVDDDVNDDLDDDANDDADDDVDDDTNEGLPLIPGPGQVGYDAELEAKALRYAQQFHEISAYPTGMFLQAEIPDADKRALVDDYLTNSDPTQSYEEYSGESVYTLMAEYGQHGDMCAFGGVSMFGDAARYVMARDGLVRADVESLRQNIIDILDTLHIVADITGTPGHVARGIRPLDHPGAIPETIPLFDDYGEPLPEEKRITWRADNSVGGIYPGYIWKDDLSKDQLNGYMLGIGTMWDVIADDPDIPVEYKERMRQDAADIGDHLMEVAPETGLDLTLRDPDGRLTKHHDLNPLEIEGVVLPPIVGNGFNALMALSFIKTIGLITGEQRFIDFFNELIEERDFLKYVDQTFKFAYVGPYTNWSNINMSYSAIYPLLRYEADADLFAYWQGVLDDSLWHSWYPDWEVAHGGQAFFALIHAAFAPDGTDIEAAEQAARDLAGFPDPPYWNPEVVNCDAEEIAQGECLAVDGETVLTLAGNWVLGTFYPSLGHNDVLQATEPLPRELWPPSHFAWHRSPYRVNDDYNNRLNPGGDFHAVYWLGRYLVRSNDPRANVSEHAW